MRLDDKTREGILILLGKEIEDLTNSKEWKKLRDLDIALRNLRYGIRGIKKD